MKLFIALFALFPALAFADDVVAVVPTTGTDLSNFLASVVQVGSSLGGMPWAAKVAAIIMLILGALKVDGIKAAVWNKIPASIQPFLAPVLGLIGGIISIHPLTFASALAYMSAGAGAIVFYELLDAIGVAAASNKILTPIVDALKSIVKPKSA